MLDVPDQENLECKFWHNPDCYRVHQVLWKTIAGFEHDTLRRKYLHALVCILICYTNISDFDFVINHEMIKSGRADPQQTEHVFPVFDYFGDVRITACKTGTHKGLPCVLLP